MTIYRKLLIIALLAGVLATGACQRLLPPPHPLVQTMNQLPDDVFEPVRNTVWAHGNPYNWDRAENLVMDVVWSDYRLGHEPIIRNKRYVIQLKEDSMRVESPQDEVIALVERGRWRLFKQGRPVRMPENVTRDNAVDAVAIEHSAGELRAVRTFFSMPFALIMPGVKLESEGVIESPGGGRRWDVIRATFDPAVTGHIRGDRLLIYIEPVENRVDRILVLLHDDPFYGLPHWAEYSRYRLIDDSLLLPQRIDFRRTDEQGSADLGRRLVLEVRRAALNVDLPANLFSDPAIAAPEPRQGEAGPAQVRRIGRDAIDP